MSEFLTDHAVRNVWCNPKQDLQVTYQPQRISVPRGEIASFTHMWTTVPLPTTTHRYHIYQIGQYAPMLMGLNPQRRVWRSLASLMNERNLFANLYTATGLNLAKFWAYVLVTDEQNVLLAVRQQDRIAPLRTTPIFLRLYTNSFFSSERSDNYDHEIVCEGREVITSDHALNIQRRFHELRDLGVGHTWLYVNGQYRSDYPPNDFRPYDVVEVVRDSTVKAVKEFTISQLQTFDSEKDQKRKYLLHYTGDQVGGVQIDYRDDIDVYITRPRSGGRFEGVYYHKNNDDALRQVTHRDYAIVVDYVVGYQQAMQSQGWSNVNNLKVQLFIRHSGYARPLVFEHHRIQELYKLPEADRLDAMVGLDSTVPQWRAEALENSPYVQIMDARKRHVDTELVRDAYGYNAIAKLIGDTPSRVRTHAGRRLVSLPYALENDSTVFEINALGKLIGSYIHTAGAEYTPFNAQCQMIEAIAGRGGAKLDMVFNRQDVAIDPKLSYRFYVAPISHGDLRNDQWEDVTGDETKYAIINGRVQWFVNLAYNAVCVKSDSHFLNYELALAPQNGVLRFSVNATTVWNNLELSSVLHIPPGRLDLWLNDECLIEGLDYFVNWPEIVITNKQYLIQGQAQRIRIRGTGFCNSDLSRQPPKEAGFVRWGKLSRNSRFDLRDDRVIRLVVGGRTYHRDDVHFTEESPELWMDNVPNGSPYTLEDLVVPLRKVVPDDTYALRALSLEVDEAVSNYLSHKLPEPVPENPDPIPERYAIYSPFAAAVMYDLINERLSTENFRGHYSDQDVRQFLAGYEHLLQYDPTRHPIDLTHVAIHPHDRTTEVELDAYQYFLLSRAIRVFLEDKVDITRFVRIKDSFI